MANARVDLSLGPDFVESKTLTWKTDGLIFLPVSGGGCSTTRITTHGSGFVGSLPTSDTDEHALWFTVYSNETTQSLFPLWGEGGCGTFLIGDYIYVVRKVQHDFPTDGFQRFYVYMVSVGRHES